MAEPQSLYVFLGLCVLFINFLLFNFVALMLCITIFKNDSQFFAINIGFNADIEINNNCVRYRFCQLLNANIAFFLFERVCQKVLIE